MKGEYKQAIILTHPI